MMRFLGIISLVFLFTACDPSRVFEDNQDLENGIWVKDQKVAFRFDIEDANQAYNIYANIRNAQHFPYRNLYYQFQLADTSGVVLKKELKNIDLFEAKTGKPFGSGLGDVFDHQQLIIDEFNFPNAGQYELTFEQYMRVDTLSLIMSMGTRVESHKK